MEKQNKLRNKIIFEEFVTEKPSFNKAPEN